MNLKAGLIVLILLSIIAVEFVVAQTQPIQNTTPQKPEGEDRAIGDSYATLRPQQQRLVDEFVGRYNQATGKELVPQQAYDSARLSVRTTFDAVTHALLHANMTDSTGKSLGHAIDLVASRTAPPRGLFPRTRWFMSNLSSKNHKRFPETEQL
jgi:hypothetical protein